MSLSWFHDQQWGRDGSKGKRRRDGRWARGLNLLPHPHTHEKKNRVYPNAVSKSGLVGDQIEAAGEFLGVSLRRPIDR